MTGPAVAGRSVTSLAADGKMASQSQGVQQLLAAEKKAAERVAEARKRKEGSFYLIYFRGWCGFEGRFVVMGGLEKCF